MQILVTNLTSGPFSLDLSFGDRRNVRENLALGGSVDISNVASPDEANSHPVLTELRSGLSPKVSVSLVPEAGDLDNLSGGGTTASLAVRAASTANVTLSGEQTVDGVALVAGDLFLAKNQTAAAENGPYVVATGAWSRAPGYNSSAEMVPGLVVSVAEGTANGDTNWQLTTDAPIVLGTTALTFGSAAVSAHAIGSATHTASTLAALNALVSDATLDDSGASRPPSGAAGGDLSGTYPNPTLGAIAGDLNHDGSNVGFYGTAPAAQAAASANLTDSSGGTADGTVAAVSGSGADADINNNFAELSTKVNDILTALRAVGLIAT